MRTCNRHVKLECVRQHCLVLKLVANMDMTIIPMLLLEFQLTCKQIAEVPLMVNHITACQQHVWVVGVVKTEWACYLQASMAELMM